MITCVNKVAVIKKLAALLLLFVLAIGIMPKRTLHTWFANHRDSSVKLTADKAPQLTKAGFTCNCDDLVAESHFIVFCNSFVTNISVAYLIAHPHIVVCISSDVFHKNLRGPPSTI